ncbi:MAG: DNA primase [bacterium]
MSSTAERIKEKLSVADVLGSYIKLEKSGANYKARCPFHNEKTPSFMISPARNSYYCFGCQASGDIFTFVQEFEKLDFVGALKLLADKAGIPLDDFQNNKDKGKENRLREATDEASKIYENELQKNKPSYDYLTGRGLTKETIIEWRIGFAPDEWRFAQDKLLQKRFSIPELLEAGLVKKKDEGSNDTYDRFRNRIMFPIFDGMNHIVGFSGRIMGPEKEGSPKYLNSPETPLFNKSEVMYGLHKAKEGIRKWGYAIVVEGQMDLLMSHQAGFGNTLATSGTSLTKDHLTKIKRYTDKLMIVYDADSAGVRASVRAWSMSLSVGLDVKIAILPKGEDPASLILKDADAFKLALKNTKHVVEFVLEQILSRYHGEIRANSREIGKAVNAELLPLVASIESSIDRAHFVSLISNRTFIPQESIQEDLTKTKPLDMQSAGGNISAPNPSISAVKSVSAPTSGLTEVSQSDKVVLETVKRLSGIALMSAEQLNTPTDADPTSTSISDLSQQRAMRVKTEVHRILHDAPHIEKEFEQVLIDAPNKLIFETELLYKGSTTLDKEIEVLLMSLEEAIVKKKFSDYMHEMQVAEKSGDKTRAVELLQKCQELSQAMSALQHKRMDLG